MESTSEPFAPPNRPHTADNDSALPPDASAIDTPAAFLHILRHGFQEPRARFKRRILEKEDPKPLGIRYGMEERPPVWQALLLIVQHLLTISGALVIPALIAMEGGATAQEAGRLLAASLLAMGIGTVLQANPRTGSGYLLTAVLRRGIHPGFDSRVPERGVLPARGNAHRHRPRPILPRAPRHQAALPFPGRSDRGRGPHDRRLPGQNTVAGSFLGAADGRLFVDSGAILASPCSPWPCSRRPASGGSGMVRQYALLIGVLGGSLFCRLFYPAGASPRRRGRKSADPGHPRSVQAGWSWRPELLGPFVIAGLCSLLGTLGNVTACQKINTTDWRRPDMNRLGKGGLCRGRGAIWPRGLLGSAGLGSNASSAGLSLATGVTSRRIATGRGSRLYGSGPISRPDLPLCPAPRGRSSTPCPRLQREFRGAGGDPDPAVAHGRCPQDLPSIGLPIVAGLVVEMNPAIAEAAPPGLAPPGHLGPLGVRHCRRGPEPALQDRGEKNGAFGVGPPGRRLPTDQTVHGGEGVGLGHAAGGRRTGPPFALHQYAEAVAGRGRGLPRPSGRPRASMSFSSPSKSPIPEA